MNNTKRFSGKAENYSKYRPKYPIEYLEYLQSEAGLSKRCVAADIGSGTGILTSQIAKLSKKVYAVEPNYDMMNKAKNLLSDFSNICFINSVAEQTQIPESSIDLITVGQAFHWFDLDLFKAECKRIARPRSCVSLVWNNRDCENKCIDENLRIFKKYCTDFNGFSGGTDFNKLIIKLGNFFKDGIFEVKEFANPFKFNKNAFIGRCLSSSYAPNPTDDLYNDFLFEIEELFEKFSKNGILNYPYITRSYTGIIK